MSEPRQVVGGNSQLNVAVLGAGSWGTALANHLAGKGHAVTLWGRDRETLDRIDREKIHHKYFPGVKLSGLFQVTTELKSALEGAELVVVSLPSTAYRPVMKQAKQWLSSECYLVSTAKGIEPGTLKPLSAVLEEESHGSERIAVLSGPSFAREVLLGLPTAVTIAAKNKDVALHVAKQFHSQSFRVYTSEDVVGVELGGVIKNVIALAAGIVDGAGMGSNARAALITRGLVEMQRLVIALGGKAQTIAGLSGLGDLLLTATGDLSRNRQVGLGLGRGQELAEVTGRIGQTSEGVAVAKLLRDLARQKGVETPIIDEVAKIVDGESSVQQAVMKLLARPGKEEAG